MAPHTILSSATNVSEGRRSDVLADLAKAADGFVAVVDVSSDPDHNRSVLTMCGPARRLVDGILALATVAVEMIDISVHEGVHPRLGALDVVPFTPQLDASMDEADRAARSCAERIWYELAVPCFLYEASASTPERTRLPDIRRTAFKGLFPDVGAPEPHPTAGATVVGARGPLVAFNVNLMTGNRAAAKTIAAEIRAGQRSLPGVRTLGLRLESRGLSQVSMNITRPDLCTVADAYKRVEELARERSIEVESSELVGVVRAADLGTRDYSTLRLRAKPKIFDRLFEISGRGAVRPV
jgi:glutamate formiminotransferase